jgi:hypothetical protein
MADQKRKTSSRLETPAKKKIEEIEPLPDEALEDVSGGTDPGGLCSPDCPPVS